MNNQLNSTRHPLRFIGSLGLASGALTGGLLTAPLVGIMYLLDNLIDLPFVPFALFDWIARVLPGPLVTFGIDSMIDIILMFGFSVADVAKTAEQAMAVLLFLVIGILITSAFFAAMNLWKIPTRPVSGIVVALLLGIPMILVSLPGGRPQLDTTLIVVALMVPFLVSGVPTLVVYRTLLNR
ncbi:MAG: hypothetical protein H8E48_01560, partial [Chloroflexi bacterium]|nr:hypothetical protein [Chloroflexota bacterium]